jgi:hypothetical protein
MYCSECKALLAIVPIFPEEEKDVKAINKIVRERRADG